jgi:DNA-binding transcriptional LysR family regulator
MYDLHRLRLLRELKARGTLAAVADALSYSPSSVSQQLSRLETEVGTPLMERVGRGVQLTPQAQVLVEHVDAVLRQLDLAKADVAASLGQVAGELRVASFQTAALALVPAALDAMRTAHPHLRVRVRHSEPELALPALAARDFDLVLAEEYPGNPLPRQPGVQFAPLCTDRLRLAGDGQRSLTALATRAWIMEPPDSRARQWAVAMCRDAGFEPDVRFESTDLLLHARLAEQHHAVAFVPDLVWAGSSPTIPLTDLPARRSTRRILTACRAGANRHPAVVAFRGALADAATAATAPAAGFEEIGRSPGGVLDG